MQIKAGRIADVDFGDLVPLFTFNLKRHEPCQ